MVCVSVQFLFELCGENKIESKRPIAGCIYIWRWLGSLVGGWLDACWCGFLILECGWWQTMLSHLNTLLSARQIKGGQQIPEERRKGDTLPSRGQADRKRYECCSGHCTCQRDRVQPQLYTRRNQGEVERERRKDRWFNERRTRCHIRSCNPTTGSTCERKDHN